MTKEDIGIVEKLRSLNDGWGAGLLAGEQPLGELGTEAAAIIMEMVEALEKVRDQFDFYVSAHMAKQHPDMDKAATNQEFVEMLDTLLAKVSGK